jgi:hypothetical protein
MILSSLKNFKFLRGYDLKNILIVDEGTSRNRGVITFNEGVQSIRYLVRINHYPSYHNEMIRMGNHIIPGRTIWNDMEFTIEDIIGQNNNHEIFEFISTLFNSHQQVTIQLEAINQLGIVYSKWNIIGFVYGIRTDYSNETLLPIHAITIRPDVVINVYE